METIMLSEISSAHNFGACTNVSCFDIILISSTIDTLHNTINGYEIACIWNSKYNVHVYMYDPNKCWFNISKTYWFLFLVDFKLRKI